MVVCRLSHRGKSRKGGPQTPLRCAQNAAFCKAFASAAGSRPDRRRKAGAPVGGASASAGANALSAKDGVSIYGQPARKSAKKRLSQKDKSGAARPERLRQGSAQTAAGRNGAVCGRRRARPRSCLILLTRKVFAGRLILRGPSYDQSKKTPNGRRGGPAGRKAAGKNAQGRSGRPSGTASAGRTRRTAKIAASGGFSPRSRANRTRRRGRASDRKNERFLPPLRLVKEGTFSKPLRGRGFARLLRKAERKGDKARAGRLGGRKRAPKRARGEDPRRRASRRAGVENLRRYLRLAGGPLVLQQLQRTFFVLVFLYFDYDCTQSPAHCAAEKTGRTIFS